MKNNSSVMLHICCAPCATAAVEKLKEDKYNITGFFYNPNIYPEKEYDKRLSNLSIFAQKISLRVLQSIYAPKKWQKQVEDMEMFEEGGKRCEKCFRIRLEETAIKAKQEGMQAFTTTLTVSPHKSEKLINSIGTEIGERYGIEFLRYDFKKQDGFKRSIILSKTYNLYRQNYCGCSFSIKNKPYASGIAPAVACQK